MSNLRMKYIYKILIICVMLCFTTFVFSQHTDGDFDTDKQAVELTINGEKITVQSLPLNGFVEVFNILGTKVTGFQITAGINSSRVNLPKGYYILKSDNVTRKIVIK